MYKATNQNLTVLADEKLLVQALINIVKNSVESLSGKTDGVIDISSGITEDHRTYIAVSDNGCGIDPGDLDKVFVPFFTTKESGSGIGLSFTREVMRIHKGNIHISSKPAAGTTIHLVF
jgi:signal transduction histidine kinase